MSTTVVVVPMLPMFIQMDISTLMLAEVQVARDRAARRENAPSGPRGGRWGRFCFWSRGAMQRPER